MKDSASSAPATTIGTARTGPPRGALLVIFLTVFIDLLGFGIVLPVMPRQAGPYLEALHLSPLAAGATIGLLFSVFSLMQFVFSPIWGRWSDRVGRRPMLLLSLAGSVIFYALYGFAVTIPPERAALAIGLMMLARIGAGIAGASVGTAAAVIADCTTPQNRSRGMALIGIAFGAGFTLGPLIAYFGMKLFNDRPWAVGALASALSAVAFLFAFFVFRETRDPANRAGKEFFSVSRSARVLAIPAVGALVLIYFLSIFSFANFEATLARLTEEAFGMSDDDNFLVFAGIGLVLMLAGGSYRPLAKRVSETRLLTVGLLLMPWRESSTRTPGAKVCRRPGCAACSMPPQGCRCGDSRSSIRRSPRSSPAVPTRRRRGRFSGSISRSRRWGGSSGRSAARCCSRSIRRGCCPMPSRW